MIDDTSSNAFTQHVETIGSSPVRSDSLDLTGNANSRMDAFSDAVELLAELSQAGLGDVDQGLQETVEQLGETRRLRRDVAVNFRRR